MKPFVSVIIPCRNEAASIGRCLDSVLASDYPAACLEVLAADGMSTDGTRETLARYTTLDLRVRVIDNPARITPIALNLMIDAAQGAFILRVDAHSTIAPAYVANLIGFLEAHPKAWGAGGLMRTEAETTGPFAAAIATVLGHRFGVGNSGFRTARALPEPRRVDTVFNCCWRREVFERIGGFHEQLVRSQDIELSGRIGRSGGELWLVPSAETTYFARTAFYSYLRHNWVNGVWSIVPAIHLGRLPVRVRHLIPLAFVGALLVASVATVVWPWALPAVAAPYIAVNLLASLQAAVAQRSLRLAVLLPFAFAGLHLPYGFGSLWGAFRLAAHLLRPSLLVSKTAPTT